MIEYYIDDKTGERKPRQLVENQMYQFWLDYHSNRITEEEKAKGVVAKLTADYSGVILENDKKVVRFEFIYFVLSPENPRQTFSDFMDVKVILPENAVKQIDPGQVWKVESDAKILYKWNPMRDPFFLSKIPVKTAQMIKIIREYNELYGENLPYKTRRISQ